VASALDLRSPGRRFCPTSALMRSATGDAPWHGNVRSKYDWATAAFALEVRGCHARCLYPLTHVGVAHCVADIPPAFSAPSL